MYLLLYLFSTHLGWMIKLADIFQHDLSVRGVPIKTFTTNHPKNVCQNQEKLIPKNGTHENKTQNYLAQCWEYWQQQINDNFKYLYRVVYHTKITICFLVCCELGCHACGLETLNLNLGVYRSLGFVEYLVLAMAELSTLIRQAASFWEHFLWKWDATYNIVLWISLFSESTWLCFHSQDSFDASVHIFNLLWRVYCLLLQKTI